jgi:hypothetical protein
MASASPGAPMVSPTGGVPTAPGAPDETVPSIFSEGREPSLPSTERSNLDRQPIVDENGNFVRNRVPFNQSPGSVRYSPEANAMLSRMRQANAPRQVQVTERAKMQDMMHRGFVPVSNNNTMIQAMMMGLNPEQAMEASIRLAQVQGTLANEREKTDILRQDAGARNAEAKVNAERWEAEKNLREKELEYKTGTNPVVLNRQRSAAESLKKIMDANGKIPKADLLQLMDDAGIPPAEQMGYAGYAQDPTTRVERGPDGRWRPAKGILGRGIEKARSGIGGMVYGG